jgi:hypothetical protein
LGVVGATMAFYVVVLIRPDTVWRINAPLNIQMRRHNSLRQQARWYHVALTVVAMIGTGICVNAGVSDLLMWMPKSWRSDNGVWMAEAIAGIAGIISSLALPLGAVQMSSKVGEYKEEVEHLTAVVGRLQQDHR